MRTISVILATLNSGSVLENCLKSIREQDYDQSLVEIILADGGSKDNTLEIAQKYLAQVVPENTGSPEGAKAVALKRAQNELILEVDDDNILPDKKWLARMVECLEKEPQAVASYPWRYTYRKEDKVLNRYFSLFGVNDPVAYFLARADRQSWGSEKYTLAGQAEDKRDYFLVKFTPENLPTVGANGFLIKRGVLLKARVDERHFFHIDVNHDLVSLGFNQYVVVKNDIVHASGENFCRFFQKRQRYLQELYLRDSGNRRYFLYNPQKDRLKILLYSLVSLTLIYPTLQALKGYVKIRDRAWFLHPVVCFLIFWIYFWAVIRKTLLEPTRKQTYRSSKK
jgi:glycosyltransferase involved in cell wall biosynthesis